MPKFKKNFQKVFAVFTLIISFTLCISLADLFSSLITVSNFSNKEVTQSKSTAFSAYAISLLNSTVRSYANEFAITVQKSGGAGFVWEDNNTYYVIASVYLEKNDAELVKNNIQTENVTPEIITLTFPEATFENNYNSTQLELINNLLEVNRASYQKLYDISVSLDTNIISDTDAKLEIGTEVSRVSKLLSNFSALFTTNLTNDLLLLKLTCNDVLALLEELVYYVPSNVQTLSSKIKYNYTDILYNFMHLSLLQK